MSYESISSGICVKLMGIMAKIMRFVGRAFNINFFCSTSSPASFNNNLRNGKRWEGIKLYLEYINTLLSLCLFNFIFLQETVDETRKRVAKQERGK